MARILILDDDLNILDSLKRLLARKSLQLLDLTQYLIRAKRYLKYILDTRFPSNYHTE